MLKIVVPASEQWDEVNQVFINTKEQTLQLEHSLVSLSKWESKWCKPFIQNNDKTNEEILDYIKCMTLTQNVDPNVYLCLTEQNLLDINSYIESPMTATFFNEFEPRTFNNEIITAEIIYYWMITLNIPFECQKWHINRLLTLIRVCNIKNAPDRKMSVNEIMRRNSELNDARRKKLNTKG